VGLLSDGKSRCGSSTAAEYALEDVTDLIEARFIGYGWLHQRRDRDGYILRLNSPAWFDICLPDEDPDGIAE
jgi:hypothetical protein